MPTIFQVDAATGVQILWAYGDPAENVTIVTAEFIDNEIAFNAGASVMEIHRTLFNKWLTDCVVSTDIGGLAQTLPQMQVYTKIFRMICLYAYSKNKFTQEMASGKCDCTCEAKRTAFLKSLSNAICELIPIECLRKKYLDWYHKICDTKGSLVSFFSSAVVVKECCYPIVIQHEEDDCSCCGS